MNRIVVEYDSKKTLQAFVTSHSALEAKQSMGTSRRISKVWLSPHAMYQAMDTCSACPVEDTPGDEIEQSCAETP